MPHRGSPPLLNLHFLIILAVPISAFLLLFFAAPFTSHKIRPPTSAVKSSWDSLNIFLVLFAILCGIFAKRNDDDSTPNDTAPQNNNLSHSDHEKPARPVVSKQWFDQLQDHNRFNQTVSDTPATSVTRLKRSSSSYPDLRQESFWETGDDRFRFFDDFEIHKYQSSAASSSTDYTHRRQRTFDDSEIKEIPVDTSFHSSSPPPPHSPAPPPPPPPPLPQTTRQKRSKTYNSVPRREKPSNKVPTPPPPPPRPPPSPLATKIIRSGGKSERKKNNATKEIKMVFASLYNQRKRKKMQRTKSVSSENEDSSPHTSPEQPSVTYQPPPPPPPPPPPSVFHNLFRKGSRIKRIHSFSAPPPPQYNRRNHVPPPPPAPPTLPPRRSNQTTSGRPPLPTRVTNNFYDENVNSGGQSPLIPMPPPPPPPPFRVPGFRFVMKGDFVNIRSAQSSRCGSPDPEEVEKESTEGVITMDGKDKTSLGTHFCPSPDVNLKADSFIARLRDEWMLEKVNSWREKAKAGHGSGPMTGR